MRRVEVRWCLVNSAFPGLEMLPIFILFLRNFYIFSLDFGGNGAYPGEPLRKIENIFSFCDFLHVLLEGVNSDLTFQFVVDLL